MTKTIYDLTGLSRDQIMHIIVSDYIEGYSTKQIMDMYDLSFVQVAEYKNEYLKDNPANSMDFAARKKEVSE
jgi:transposase